MYQGFIDYGASMDIDDAVDWMSQGRAITDGEYIFGISNVMCFDGYSVPSVFRYLEWDQMPVEYMGHADIWEENNQNKKFYVYKLPLTAKEALEEMKQEGAIFEDLDNPNHVFHYTALKNPITDIWVEYVFERVNALTTPVILPAEDFVKNNPGRHYWPYKDLNKNKEEE